MYATRYDLDGYLVRSLLDQAELAQLTHEAHRIATAARFLDPQPDFVFQPDTGDQHRLPPTELTGARSRVVAGWAALRRLPAPRRSTRNAPANQTLRSADAPAPVLRAVRRAVRYSPAAASLACDPRTITLARDAAGAPSVDLVESLLLLAPGVLDSGDIDSARPAGHVEPLPELAPDQLAPNVLVDPNLLDRRVTVWIALDPADSLRGCLRVMPGSHRYHLIAGDSLRPEDLTGVHDVPLAAGQAIVLHPGLLRVSGPTHVGAPPRALILRYAHRPEATS